MITSCSTDGSSVGNTGPIWPNYLMLHLAKLAEDVLQIPRHLLLITKALA